MNIYLAGQSSCVNLMPQVAEDIADAWGGILNFTELWWETTQKEMGISRDRDERDQVLAHCAEMDRAAIDVCDALIAVHHGGYRTAGMWWEMGYAVGLGKPVFTLEYLLKRNKQYGLSLTPNIFLSQATMRFNISCREDIPPAIAIIKSLLL